MSNYALQAYVSATTQNCFPYALHYFNISNTTKILTEINK